MELKMNIAVIGLGSMGKRRLRLLKKHFTNITICGIDTNIERRTYCEKEYGIKTFIGMQDALKEIKVDCVFVCTSPLAHDKIIHHCLELKIHVFTELNLVCDGYKENIALSKEKEVILFLSSTALYRKETQFIIEKVQEDKKPICYSYHVGQYLPDWHPWENYQNFFIGNKKTNGCREILAIELPWIIAAFGKISNMNVLTGRSTTLNIDYSDYYMIQFTHENGNRGNVIVDIVCREAVRKLEVFSETMYMEWQGKPESLKSKNLKTKELEAVQLYDEIDKLEGYSSTIIENQYLDEIKAFFDEIHGIKSSKYTFEDDFYTLAVIDKIEGNTAL
jgi:predicted dehydrogenase